MSPGNPWLTTGIPVGKPTGMETPGSELPIITGLHRSGFLFWVLQVLATSTHETKILFIYFTNLIDYYISLENTGLAQVLFFLFSGSVD